jgi:outer membrane immunogenic protein
MKRSLLASLAVFAFATGSASAADIAPSYKAPPPYVPPCAQFGGFYVGGHLGGVSHDWTWNDRNAWAKNEVDLALPSSVSSTKSGFTGGVQVGYNWQARCSLFGFEADWSWAGLKRDKFNTDGQPGLALDQLNVSTELKWYGTLRTRAGVVVDNLLIYVTGGLAYARIDHTAALTDFLGAPGFVTETFSDSRTRWGWTAGVGTEWAMWGNWSLKSEALYVRLAERDSTFNSGFAVLNGNPAGKSFDYQDSLWITRIGINYRFGGGGRPY